MGRWQVNKLGHLHRRLVLGSHKNDLCICLQILTVCIEALTGFSHIYCPDGLNATLLSQGYVLRAASESREAKWNLHCKDRGGGEEPPIVQVWLTGHTSSQ